MRCALRIAFVIFVEPHAFLSSFLNPRKFTLSHHILISLQYYYIKSKTNQVDLGDWGRWVPKMSSSLECLAYHPMIISTWVVDWNTTPFLQNEILSLLLYWIVYWQFAQFLKNFNYKKPIILDLYFRKYTND